MKIIYIASIYSNGLNDYFLKVIKYSAFQKFHTLIINGFIKNNQNLTIISSANNNSFYNKPLIEKNRLLSFYYLFYINIPIVKHIFIVVFSFFKIIFKRTDVIICDVLNISSCIGAVIAGKVKGCKTVGLVTDIPGLMVHCNKNKLGSIIKLVNKSLINSFDSYIFLTEQMNEVLNPKNKPYLIMEGLIENYDLNEINFSKKNNNQKVIMYAGGLYEKYGIKTLIEAFLLIENENISLHIYGSGPMELQIIGYTQKDKRIIYKGAVPNEDVIIAEKNAFLLINPRPTSEEFTKYSFPSKNLEYMQSGTPLVTTKLPGMPIDYYPYIYIIEDESIKGYYNTLATLLSLEINTLEAKGNLAKQYVLKNKNNIIQTQRILDFIRK